MAAICVFCSSARSQPPGWVALAEAVGREIAARGHSLVWGGGETGLMGIVAHAAQDAGARTVGVIPEALVGPEFAFRSADELLVVEGMRERKAAMDARADAFLALPGGLGTLEELLEMATLRQLGYHHRPVVLVDPGFWAPFVAWVEQLTAAGLVRAHPAPWTVAADAAAALDLVAASLAAPH